MSNIKVLLDGFTFLEGPRWRDGKLWVSDMHDQRVLTVDSTGRAETVCEVPNSPSGLGWLYTTLTYQSPSLRNVSNFETKNCHMAHFILILMNYLSV